MESTIYDKTYYLIKLWVLISAFLIAVVIITKLTIFGWSWDFRILVPLEFGAGLLSILYVIGNWNNSLGFAELW